MPPKTHGRRIVDPNKFPIKRNDSLNKFLFSSPMHFGGMYESPCFYLHHAFPGSRNDALRNQQTIRNSATRYYYVLLFHGNPTTKMGKISRVNDYNYFAEEVVASLAVFYGKQFDSHGIIERAGMFELSDMTRVLPLRDIYLSPFNGKPRVNASVDLNFTKCGAILKLFERGNGIDDRLGHVFKLAARLYLRSLQSFHYDMESAYMDLVVCGEIIAGYYDDYTDKQKYDDELRSTLQRLDEAGIEEAHINRIKDKIYSVKRKFSLGLQRLLNDTFFNNREALYEHYSINRDNIIQLTRNTYDLRSEHTHSGKHIGSMIHSPMGEICYGMPKDTKPKPKSKSKSESKSKSKGRSKAKTVEERSASFPGFFSYSGLERLIRFCLLSILHSGGLKMHKDLEPDPGFDIGKLSPVPPEIVTTTKTKVKPKRKQTVPKPSTPQRVVDQETRDRAIMTLEKYLRDHGSKYTVDQLDLSDYRWSGNDLLINTIKGKTEAKLQDGVNVIYFRRK